MKNMTEKFAMVMALAVMVSLFVLGIRTVYEVAERYEMSVVAVEVSDGRDENR